MTLPDTLKDFREGRLSKAAFIERMYRHHAVLFEYAELVGSGDLESIVVGRDRISVRFQWPPVELEIPPSEMRAAPVEALNFGSYEKREFAVVESVVASLPGDSPVFVDIGGNVGFYSIGLKKLHPRLRIHAFEPVPATAGQFERNCGLNNCSDIQLHRCGLSDRPGKAVFHVHPRMSVAASQEDILGGGEMTRVECELRRLDDMAGVIPAPVSFIKCDVEGAELFAFRGAEATIRRDRPVVFSEMLRKWSAKFGYHPDDIIRFFSGIGYRCMALGAGGIREIGAVTEDTAETNFIFLHREQHEGIRLHS